MHAAVIKLDALADPVRAAAQHHDLFALGRLGLAFAVFGLVGRVEVGRVGGKLGSTGVDPLVDRTHAEFMPTLADEGVRGFKLPSQPPVRKAFLLERTQRQRIDRVERGGFELELYLDDLLDLHQKPGVNFG